MSSPWVVRPQPRVLNGRGRGEKANLRPYIADGRILPQYNVVPLKKVPVRVLKYDVSLRDASLRAVQAMHTILTRIVFFYIVLCAWSVSRLSILRTSHHRPLLLRWKF